MTDHDGKPTAESTIAEALGWMLENGTPEVVVSCAFELEGGGQRVAGEQAVTVRIGGALSKPELWV